jgi:DNA-binding MarR family transcriptional regulator
MRTKLRLEEFIPYRLSLTSNLVSDFIAATYEQRFAISIPEWRVLAWVAEREDISQKEICRLTQMDKVTVSRATIALLRRALMQRKANPRDRRSHLLTLSAAGKTLYEEVAPQALELERRLFSNFEDGEVMTFATMLRRIESLILAMSAEKG